MAKAQRNSNALRSIDHRDYADGIQWMGLFSPGECPAKSMGLIVIRFYS